VQWAFGACESVQWAAGAFASVQCAAAAVRGVHSVIERAAAAPAATRFVTVKLMGCTFRERGRRGRRVTPPASARPVTDQPPVGVSRYPERGICAGRVARL